MTRSARELCCLCICVVDDDVIMLCQIRAIAGAPPDLRDARQLGTALYSETDRTSNAITDGGRATVPVSASSAAAPILTVHAQAKSGVITFDPPHLDFGICMVNTAKTQVTTVQHSTAKVKQVRPIDSATLYSSTRQVICY